MLQEMQWQLSKLASMALSFKGVRVECPARMLLSKGGSPCQDLSALNVSGTGPHGARSGFFCKLIRIEKIVAAVFLDSESGSCAENTAPMLAGCAHIKSSALSGRPIIACPGAFSRVARRRLFWSPDSFRDADDQLQQVVVDPCEDDDPILFDIPPMDIRRFLQPDEMLIGGPRVVLPAMTRSVRRRHPLLKPAGLYLLNDFANPSSKTTTFR